MKTKSIKLVALAVMLVLAFAGCAPSTPAPTATPKATSAGKTIDAKDMVVGFVFVGPVSDKGWSYAHNQGRLQLEKELSVKTIYKESVSDQNADSEKAMRDLISEGAKVIFATSFGYMDYVDKLSKEYPNVYFYHCSGYKSGANFSNYFGRMYEARYLSGMIAGMKTKTDKIGYVAAFDIPEVVRMINAFTLGVQAVNPKAKVYVRWTQTWYDPAKEKDAALSLLTQEKVDVMAQHQDSPAAQIAAEEKGAFAIGYNVDTSESAPKAYLTSPVWNWGPYYVSSVKSIMAGKFKSESYWGEMSDGIVDLAPYTALVGDDIKAKVADAKSKILSKQLVVFKGPIKDQTGAVKVKEGETMSDKDLLSINWFVDGVVGKMFSKTN